MRIVRIIISILCVIIISAKQSPLHNPYSILKIGETATNSEIERQYKMLRSKNRRSRTKKAMIRKAYDQIMFSRQFKTEPQVVIPPKAAASPFPSHIDQVYVYGYLLQNEFDDGGYFQANFNETQFIIERQFKSDANKKTATLILFLGGVFVKLIPCIVLICICRRGGLGDALSRARAGYVNIGRRGNARI